MITNTVTVVSGLEPLAELHARELPQKDNLCGPFWGALALAAAGVREVDGEAVDQDFVALRAQTRLPEGDPVTFVPLGATPRNDYRLPIPLAKAGEGSGTSASALARAIERLSDGALLVVPVAGPWTPERVLSVVETVSEAAPSTTLLANIRTGALWGSRPSAATLLAQLAGEHAEAPPSEWDVGHFASLVATMRGTGGSLVAVRDSYPSLGWGGYHLQPPEALAAALERGDGREGGILCVVPCEDEPALRQRLEGLGVPIRHWDNGTPDPDAESSDGD